MKATERRVLSISVKKSNTVLHINMININTEREKKVLYNLICCSFVAVLGKPALFGSQQNYCPEKLPRPKGTSVSIYVN